MMHELAAAGYAIAAFASWSALKQSSREQQAWAMCALALALLAIDQQFRLLDGFANLVRYILMQMNLYESRRGFQRELVVSVAIVGGLIVVAIGFALRSARWQLRLAGAAVIALLALAFVKAVSLHNLDIWFTQRPRGLPITRGAGLELLGLLAVIAASVAVPRRVAGLRTSEMAPDRRPDDQG